MASNVTPIERLEDRPIGISPAAIEAEFTRLWRETAEPGLDDSSVRLRTMNFVAVGPSEILMPAGCPGIRVRFQAEGVDAHEVEVGEYLKAAGGLACLTGILARDPLGSTADSNSPCITR